MGRSRRLLTLCLATSVAGPALALSGNEQISLVGQGRFEALARDLEADAKKGALKTADLHALCYGYTRLKRYDAIMPCLDQLDRQIAAGDDETRLFGLDDATPSSALMRAETLTELGQYASAAAQAQRALDWFRDTRSSDLDIRFQALADQVIAWRLGGERKRAEAALQALEDSGLGLRGGQYRGARAIALARANMAMGRYQAVLDALDSDFNLGLRRFLDNLNTGALFTGDNNWLWLDLPRAFMAARAHQELGHVDEARKRLDALLAIPQVAHNGEIYWLALFARGRIALADGDLALAERSWQQAVGAVEKYRASISTEANKIGFVGDKTQVYDALIDLQVRRGDSVGALLTAERAKSRALVDLLAERDDFAVAAGVDVVAVRNALKTLTRAEQQARQQGDASLAAASGAEVTAARELLQRVAPGLAALIAVRTPGIAEIRRLLQPDETLLLFHQSREQLHAFTLTGKDLQVYSQPVAGLDGQIAELRQIITERAPDADQALRRLHDRLVPPALRKADGGSLLIVPHRALHYVPFAALRDERGYLVERWALRELPSAGVLPFLPPPGKGYGDRLVIFGNPDLGDSSQDLPSAEAEARAIAASTGSARLFLRKDASRLALRNEALRASALHIASHGQFRGDQPLQSALYLAPDEQSDGRLTVSDLYGLRLGSRLVVLSACETGLGAIASGDDVVGLVRGFLYAGAGAVVSSLWEVDDAATASLMTAFYQGLPTLGAREALRQAQLQTLRQYPHPFFWSAFFLTGATP